MLLPYPENVQEHKHWYLLPPELQLAISELSNGNFAGEPILERRDLDDALANTVELLATAYGARQLSDTEHGEIITNLITPIWLHHAKQFQKEKKT